MSCQTCPRTGMVGYERGTPRRAARSAPPPFSLPSSRRLTMTSDRGCRAHHSIHRYCCTIIIKKQETDGVRGRARLVPDRDVVAMHLACDEEDRGGGRGRGALQAVREELGKELGIPRTPSRIAVGLHPGVTCLGDRPSPLSHPGGKERGRQGS